MVCPTCGFKYAVGVRTIYHDNGDRSEFCDQCSRAKFSSDPDVYLGGGGGIQTDENLVDPKTREKISFSTKREKLAAMKKLGLRQADSAERHHGARPSTNKKRTYFT